MIKVRLRHPRGVSTLDIDPESTTLSDLRVLIFSSTEIPPNEQELKYGYPPKPILSAEDATLSSIPISKGEQIIVTSLPAGSSSRAQNSAETSRVPVELPPSQLPTPAPSVKQYSAELSAPQPTSSLTAGDSGKKGKVDGESIQLPGRDNGWLKLRVVPDDNSCLFSSIGVVFEGGMGKDVVKRLRGGE